MEIRKSHLIAVGLVLILLLSYFAQRAENRSALNSQRNTSIDLCVASVERASYIANGFKLLSERVGGRDNPGDAISAKDYKAVEDSIVATFPGVAKDDAQVDRIETFDGRIVFRLSDQGHILERKGCEQAFQKPATP